MTTATTTTALDDVLATIDDANLSTEDLREVSNYVHEAIKAQRKVDAARTMAAIRVGDTVEVIPGTLRPKDDRAHAGRQYRVVEKVRTRVGLSVDGRVIRFPASVLRKV